MYGTVAHGSHFGLCGGRAEGPHANREGLAWEVRLRPLDGHVEVGGVKAAAEVRGRARDRAVRAIDVEACAREGRQFCSTARMGARAAVSGGAERRYAGRGTSVRGGHERQTVLLARMALLDDDETARGEGGGTAAQKSDEVVVCQVVEHPLHPDARVDGALRTGSKVGQAAGGDGREMDRR